MLFSYCKLLQACLKINTMDKLTDTQRADIKKMSTGQLTCKLMAAGMTDEELELLDRTGIYGGSVGQNAMVLAGKDKPPTPALAAPITMGYDPSVERETFAFEKLKFEAEQIERVKRLELEVEKMQEERADKLEHKDWERAKRAKQLEQMELQTELRSRKIALQEAKVSRGEKMQDTAVARLKRFGAAMKNAITCMRNDPMELFQFL